MPQTLIDFQPAWAATFDSGGLLSGLDLDVASLMPASWTQVVSWLRQIDALRQVA